MAAQQTKILAIQVLKIVQCPSFDDCVRAFASQDRKMSRVYLTSEEGFEIEMQLLGISYVNNRRGCDISITGCALEPKGTVTTRNWRSFRALINTAQRTGLFQFFD